MIYFVGISIFVLFVMSVYNQLWIGILRDVDKISSGRINTQVDDYYELEKHVSGLLADREKTKKNLIIIIQRVNKNMANTKDLIDKLNTLKPLVDSANTTAKHAKNGLDMATLTIANLSEQVASMSAVQEDIDLAAALVDEMVISLNPPTNQ